MNTNKEKVSYCIGFDCGKNLRRQFVDMNLHLLLEGFQHAILDSEPKLKQEEIASFLKLLRQQIEEQQKNFLQNVSEENKKDGEAFLAANKEKEGIKLLASGLQYKVLQSGQGPQPTFLDSVTVHYKGSFIDGNEFDNSYSRGQPQVFPLNRVIAGWTEALQKMKVGDRWQLFIPPYLAYGEGGFGNMIPPPMQH